MTLTYISCSSDFYTFYVNVPLSLGCMIRKVSAEDIAIRGNGTGLEYMCPTRHFVYIFFNPVFQVSTAKNEINLFNNHILIVAPVTFAPAGAMTPSAEFLFLHKAYVFGYSLEASHYGISNEYRNILFGRKKKLYCYFLVKQIAFSVAFSVAMDTYTQGSFYITVQCSMFSSTCIQRTI